MRQQDHQFDRELVHVAPDRVYPLENRFIAARAYLTHVMQFSPSRPATVCARGDSSYAKNTSDRMPITPAVKMMSACAVDTWSPHARAAKLFDYSCHFTALHEMQTLFSDDNSVRLSVRPSVRPSVRQMSGLWQKRRKICSDFYTLRKII